MVKQMLRLIGGKASFDDYEAADLRISGETEVPFLLIRAYALKTSQVRVPTSLQEIKKELF